MGVNFAAQQLNEARRLAKRGRLPQVEFREGRIESLPAEDGSFRPRDSKA